MDATSEFARCKNLGNDTYITQEPLFKTYVTERFELDNRVQKYLKSLKPEFGYNGYGEFIFYRTYSRIRKEDKRQEDWADCVIRTINGVMSIRKDWYIKHCITWDELVWQLYADKMAKSMYAMEWCAPGRGLWAMGTDYIYESGSLSLYNCGFTKLDNLGSDIHWLMDALMNGVGPGFEATKSDIIPFDPTNNKEVTVIIGDSREEWCDSVKILIESYLRAGHYKIKFDYSKVRPAGLPIKRFGGISSGPEPLERLHNYIRIYFKRFLNEVNYDSVMLKTDTANQTGCCVVAGNVRRSAEIAVGDIDDETFLNLKNYESEKFKYRRGHGWMSNNSARLYKPEHFEMLNEVAKIVLVRGEPGIVNVCNLKHGRIGKLQDNVKIDEADGINPCGEIPLCNKELCNVSDTFPTRCKTIKNWEKACEYATVYCSTVALLPTHRPESNKIIAKNRRIGVGLVDFTGWKQANGVAKVTRYMRTGYGIIREKNRILANEAGVPESNRVTTVKPGGTTVNLAGRTSGIGSPNFIWMKRATRIQKNSPIFQFLVDHNVLHEPDVVSMNTEVFYFPVKKGPSKPAAQVSIWEQAMNLVLVQREWADNAVSNTINFKPMWKLMTHREYQTDEEFVSAIEDNLNQYDFSPDKFDYEWCKSRIIEEAQSVRLKIVYGFDELLGMQRVVELFEYDISHEENEIEHVLASIAPLTKSISMLPHTPAGAYLQMPEQEISEEEYYDMLNDMRTIDWTKFYGSDGVDERFCQGDSCETKRV